MILRADHVAGAFFVGVGALVIALSGDLPTGTLSLPGSGFMPKIVAVLMIFFKHGAYSFNGLIAFWVPTLSFFGWVMAMTLLGLRALRRSRPGPARAAPEQLQQPAEPAPTAMT